MYFNFSQTFAREELEKLKLFYNCNDEVNEEINDIAQDKNIKLNTAICYKAEKDGTAENIIGFIVLALVLYFFWTILKKVFIYIKTVSSRSDKI